MKLKKTSTAAHVTPQAMSLRRRPERVSGLHATPSAIAATTSTAGVGIHNSHWLQPNRSETIRPISHDTHTVAATTDTTGANDATHAASRLALRRVVTGETGRQTVR